MQLTPLVPAVVWGTRLNGCRKGGFVVPNIDPVKARERSQRYRRKLHLERFGPDAPADMRGRHRNQIRGEQHYRWRGGDPVPDRRKRLANAMASAARYPERVRARQAVRRAAKRGAIPHAASLSCADCGRQADSYDHHNGYERIHWFDVEPVCFPCHGLRSRVRGEHRVPHPGARNSRPGMPCGDPELDGAKALP